MTSLSFRLTAHYRNKESPLEKVSITTRTILEQQLPSPAIRPPMPKLALQDLGRLLGRRRRKRKRRKLR
jgi:hypothetical protein